MSDTRVTNGGTTRGFFTYRGEHSGLWYAIPKGEVSASRLCANSARELLDRINAYWTKHKR